MTTDEIKLTKTTKKIAVSLKALRTNLITQGIDDKPKLRLISDSLVYLEAAGLQVAFDVTSNQYQISLGCGYCNDKLLGYFDLETTLRIAAAYQNNTFLQRRSNTSLPDLENTGHLTDEEHDELLESLEQLFGAEIIT